MQGFGTGRWGSVDLHPVVKITRLLCYRDDDDLPLGGSPVRVGRRVLRIEPGRDTFEHLLPHAKNSLKPGVRL